MRDKENEVECGEREEHLWGSTVRIKANSIDKQSSNPHNYFQKGWKKIRGTKCNLKSDKILLNLVCFQQTLGETFIISFEERN